jgi:predicted short-subunit dehydrogenase-like oxidoreductase (DUF2520 family)
MITINIIGTGNVAWHLAQTLQNTKDYRLQAVAGRSKKKAKKFSSLAEKVCDISDLDAATITIIAVSDDAIDQVTSTIPYTNSLFVHTSGSVAMSVLSNYEHYGVFYPLQSFSKEVPVNFKEVPLCIEANKKTDLEVLNDLGFALSEKVTPISSAQRSKLHLAAVFVNNFSNHCFTIAQELCEDNKVSFDLLKPLLETTVNKALNQNPNQVQTGPAKRGDQKTMISHKEQLSNPQQKEVYRVLSDAITTYYGKKL